MTVLIGEIGSGRIGRRNSLLQEAAYREWELPPTGSGVSGVGTPSYGKRGNREKELPPTGSGVSGVGTLSYGERGIGSGNSLLRGAGNREIENGEITEPQQLVGDVNGDGVVNIQDLVIVGSNFGKTGENKVGVNGDGVVNIVDLVKVAGAFGQTAAAPALHPHALAMLTAADVQGWLTQARRLDLTDTTVQRGIIVLEHLLSMLTPKETALLPNYPNPFNPETMGKSIPTPLKASGHS